MSVYQMSFTKEKIHVKDFLQWIGAKVTDSNKSCLKDSYLNDISVKDNNAKLKSNYFD